MAFRFEHLEIWQESVRFSKIIYETIQRFPREELFALSDQLRRAVISISTNIAEGSGSESKKDFRIYLNIATKSLIEVTSLLALAKENDYIDEVSFKKLYSQAEILVRRIQAFRNSLK